MPPSSERCPDDPHYAGQTDKVRVSRLAEGQRGRVARRQLRARGIASTTIERWFHSAFLHAVRIVGVVVPGVYAVGHAAPSLEADLAAALLYAGPYAALSFATALWWLGLIDTVPPIIHVSTPRKCVSLGPVRVHGRRSVETTIHKGLRVTSATQALLDVAPTTSMSDLRYLLACAEFHKLLDLEQIAAATGRGRAGSAKLAEAARRHEPKLALTRSRFERAFIELCETEKLPLPEVNVRIGRMTVDLVYPDAKLVIELDGGANHGTVAQMKVDRARELRLRARGYTVIRYTWEQVTEQGWLVARDVRRLLAKAEAQAA